MLCSRSLSDLNLYRNIVLRDTSYCLLLLLDCCGRSQVVCKAGAWAFARPEPFLPKQLLSVSVRTCTDCNIVLRDTS